MIVVIDDREHALMQCMDIKGTTYNRQRLQLGDVIICAQNGEVPFVLMERKTIADFLQSGQTNRLHDQLSRIKEDETPEKWLVLEGCVDSSIACVAAHTASTEVAMRALYISLLSRVVLLYDKIEVIHLPSIDDTQYFVTKRLAYTQQQDTQRTNLLVWQPNKRKAYHIGYIAFLLSFPGIGMKRCRALMRKFRSLNALAAASEPDVSTVVRVRIGREMLAAFELEETLHPSQPVKEHHHKQTEIL